MRHRILRELFGCPTCYLCLVVDGLAFTNSILGKCELPIVFTDDHRRYFFGFVYSLTLGLAGIGPIWDWIRMKTLLEVFAPSERPNK